MDIDANDSPPVWRLIDTGPLDGPTNMALDEALLACFDRARSQPVLRLYGWNPPAFSVGKFQQAGDVLDLERCAREGVAVVRRVTGGGCIFHADELTYSIICSPEHISGVEGVKESYRRLCGFLLLAYRKLGLSPAFAVDSAQKHERLGRRTPLCFAGREEYDITIRGRKIGGNAQRRTRGILFQHGSIPLRNRLSRMTPFLRGDPPEQERWAVALADLDADTNDERLKGSLVTSFEENLGITLRKCAPTQEEKEKTALLRECKYLSDAWNLGAEET
jgi:lipoate-protein ligase A